MLSKSASIISIFVHENLISIVFHSIIQEKKIFLEEKNFGHKCITLASS